MNEPMPSKEEMLLAFGFETARTIAGADAHVDGSELDVIERAFPRAALVARGLLDDAGPTARFGRAYNLALAKLRSLLSDDEKRHLAQQLFDVCRADGGVDGAEVRAVVQAMAVLGVSKAQLAEQMRERIARSG